MNIKKAISNTEAIGLVSAILTETANGGPLSERTISAIANAPRSELSWDVFDALVESEYEKNTGFWFSAEVAAKLLSPIINKRGNVGTSRITYGNQEDYVNECKMEIRKRISSYDREKSKFPVFIAPWLKQVAYNFGMDASPYIMKKKNIQVFLQSTLVSNKEAAEGTKDDFAGYSGSEMSGSAEEEYLREASRALGAGVGAILEATTGDSQAALCSGAMWAKLLGGASVLPESVVKKVTLNISVEFDKPGEDVDPEVEEATI